MSHRLQWDSNEQMEEKVKRLLLVRHTLMSCEGKQTPPKTFLGQEIPGLRNEMLSHTVSPLLLGQLFVERGEGWRVLQPQAIFFP